MSQKKVLCSGCDIYCQVLAEKTDDGSILINVNRRLNGTPHRRPTGTPSIGVFCW